MSEEPKDATRILEQILGIMATTAVQGRTLSEGATLLDRAGVERRVIAQIYGTSDGSVRAVLSQSKKSIKAKGRLAP
jgi:hypothetical protein